MNREGLERLKKQGYRIISRKYGVVARIDRSDWKEYMASKHCNGMDWVEVLDRLNHAEDHYRRCYSNDKIELIPDRLLVEVIPNSNSERTGYIEKGI